KIIKNRNLTAAEASSLWTQYMANSLSICMYRYFLNIVEDHEIKAILNLALQAAQSHLVKITRFFNKANYLIPLGFTEKDVNVDAPRLFSDSFLLHYTKIML